MESKNSRKLKIVSNSNDAMIIVEMQTTFNLHTKSSGQLHFGQRDEKDLAFFSTFWFMHILLSFSEEMFF